MTSMLFGLLGGMANTERRYEKHTAKTGNMDHQRILLPDGTDFQRWEASLDFSRTLHVAQNHAHASDANNGTADHPFKTINRAAREAGPGDCVRIHAGVYRECVRPQRGGESPSRMVSYQAVPGDHVIIKGSDVATWGWEKSDTWSSTPGITIRMTRLPADVLDEGYNPFATINLPQLIAQTCFTMKPGLMPKLLARRGLVLQDGRLLTQMHSFGELRNRDGAYWVEPHGLVVHVRPYGDIDPETACFEFAVREQAFAPDRYGLAYVHVKGLLIEHVADGFPWPQRAALSTMRGHHWIIEDNVVRWCNALGIDIGKSAADMLLPDPCGYHIVRRNSISNCGICGIAGTGPLKSTLIERNHIFDCGWHDAEWYSECAGIKTHMNIDTVIRRNIIHDMKGASGIWMDWDNHNSRCCENVIINTESVFGAIFLEASQHPNMIDHNIVWGCSTCGIYEHDTDYLIIAHNLVAMAESAILLKRGDPERWLHGRGSTGKKHKVLNNILLDCGTMIEFANPDNYSNGNIFGVAGKPGAFRIHEPTENLNFAAWRDFHNYDTQGCQCRINAELDADKLTLELKLEESPPLVEPVEGILSDITGRSRRDVDVIPGPFMRLPTGKIDLHSLWNDR